MMARSQARRAAVAQILGNKENVSMTNTTRSRLQHLSTLHTETGTSNETAAPLQPCVDNIESARAAPAQRNLMSVLKEPEDGCKGNRTATVNLNDGLQDALEAQGFTPSDSRSKLYYDFKKEQQRNAAEGSPSKPSSGTEIPPPPTSPAKARTRDVSPSKVGEMRSRWEQHIRQASPERSDRSRSPRKPESPTKVTSPVRNRQMATSSNAELPSHTAENYRASSRSPEKYNPSGFSRSTSERKSWRAVSPHKPGPVGKVVKGEAPMPEAVPLVEQPFSSSVRQRAAAFDGASKLEPRKDPAEMSVQERLAIFSKKQGGALVPKAPFGQPVPAKAMQGGGGCHEAGGRACVAHAQPVARPSKRVAAEPASMLEHHEPVTHNSFAGNKPLSPDKRVTSLAQQRKTFEHIHDHWQDNTITTKIRAERQQEMDTLLNRFKKPKQGLASNTNENKHQFISERTRYTEESESEYLESDESIGETSTSEDLSQDNMPGPPKPPRLYRDPSPKTLPQQDTTATHKHLSPTKVCQSPKKDFVPKVKAGCVYPSLSDIESHSEAPDSQDEEVKDSSFAESVLTCASMESLGQKIQRAATGTRRPLSFIQENSHSQANVNPAMSESTMEALDAIDDAIEALDDGLSPTPPKRQCSRGDVSQNVYKTPRINDTPTSHHTEDQDVTLAHSISMYRRQKPDVIVTPVRQIIRRADLHSPEPEPVSPSVTVSARIKELQQEVSEQQRVIAQASNAVSVVLQRLEQQGTPQHVEAEKLLLLASQKRQSALNEIQRLKAEGALGQQSWAGEDACMGSISISNITVPLKHEFLQKGMKGDDLYNLMVLVKHREQVISSQLMTTPQCVVEGAVTFPNLMALHHLTSDFNITLEVYALCTHQPRQINMKKEQSRMKLTPLKKLHRNDGRTASPSIQSPGGPFAVRTSAFQLVGFTHLNISTLTRNAWTLEKVPYSSPLDGHLLMHVNCSFEGGISERGFLTMFEDVGGFGAWNRRWCVLSGMHLRYWRYPDDETKKEASGQLDLRYCTTRRVELVSRDVCARQHTFQLTLLRAAHPRDVTNLVQEVKGSSVVTKMLLSSDSKEERVGWCSKLNKTLANIRAWDPDALRPQDFQV
ncbi:Anillin [Chionoecetes opilio]|uniref:Anillin n=1 Tax=Chionoecetes opilio TaxID=41210 RepID=A0A8J4YCI7_CHIOP|nr:Anillin [Chionoecetes opilio]